MYGRARVVPVHEHPGALVPVVRGGVVDVAPLAPVVVEGDPSADEDVPAAAVDRGAHGRPDALRVLRALPEADRHLVAAGVERDQLVDPGVPGAGGLAAHHQDPRIYTRILA